VILINEYRLNLADARHGGRGGQMSVLNLPDSTAVTRWPTPPRHARRRRCGGHDALVSRPEFTLSGVAFGDDRRTCRLLVLVAPAGRTNGVASPAPQPTRPDTVFVSRPTPCRWPRWRRIPASLAPGAGRAPGGQRELLALSWPHPGRRRGVAPLGGASALLAQPLAACRPRTLSP
jgi:hypothetical protein